MLKLNNLESGTVKINVLGGENDKAISTITNKALADKIISGEDIVILDCRNENEYHQSHIHDAVLLNNNPMMVKRFLKGTKHIADLLQVTTNADDIVEKMNNTLTVFYDSCKPQGNFKNIIQNLISKKMSIKALEGGFQEFYNNSPDLCSEANLESNDEENDQKAILHYSTAIATSEWERAPPAKILPHLILGNGLDSENKQLLKKLKVGYIINATKHLTTRFENDFIYKKIEVSDTTGQDLSQHFQAAFDFIEIARKNGSVVFIHCHAGISRSVSITIAYMIKFYKMDLSQAYNFIKSRRPCVAPNLNFMGQLLTFEKEVRDEEIKTPVPAKQTIEINQNSTLDRLSLVSKLISIPSIHLTHQCSEEEYMIVNTPKMSLDKTISNSFESIDSRKNSTPLCDWKSLPPTMSSNTTNQDKNDTPINLNKFQRPRLNTSHSDLEIVGKAIFPVSSPTSRSSTDLTLMGRRGSVAQIVTNYEKQFKIEGLNSRCPL